MEVTGSGCGADVSDHTSVAPVLRRRLGAEGDTRDTPLASPAAAFTSGRTHTRILLSRSFQTGPIPEGVGSEYHFGLKAVSPTRSPRSAGSDHRAGVVCSCLRPHGHTAVHPRPDGTRGRADIDVQPEVWHDDPTAIYSQSSRAAVASTRQALVGREERRAHVLRADRGSRCEAWAINRRSRPQGRRSPASRRGACSQAPLRRGNAMNRSACGAVRRRGAPKFQHGARTSAPYRRWRERVAEAELGHGEVDPLAPILKRSGGSSDVG